MTHFGENNSHKAGGTQSRVLKRAEIIIQTIEDN